MNEIMDIKYFDLVYESKLNQRLWDEIINKCCTIFFKTLKIKNIYDSIFIEAICWEGL